MTINKRDDGLYDLYVDEQCFEAITWDEVIVLMEKYENSGGNN